MTPPQTEAGAGVSPLPHSKFYSLGLPPCSWLQRLGCVWNELSHPLNAVSKADTTAADQDAPCFCGQGKYGKRFRVSGTTAGASQFPNTLPAQKRAPTWAVWSQTTFCQARGNGNPWSLRKPPPGKLPLCTLAVNGRTDRCYSHLVHRGVETCGDLLNVTMMRGTTGI